MTDLMIEAKGLTKHYNLPVAEWAKWRCRRCHKGDILAPIHSSLGAAAGKMVPHIF